jgi:hypothetical protein
MKETSDALIGIVKDFYAKYQSLSDTITSMRLSEDKWTLKEIIGHLIDSASNNHQRFVRLQLVDNLIFPGFKNDNEKWLQIEQYNALSWISVLSLWKEYNLLIANIVVNVKKDSLAHTWLADKKSTRLDDLINNYILHLKEHIAHFQDRYDEIVS